VNIQVGAKREEGVRFNKKMEGMDGDCGDSLFGRDKRKADITLKRILL